MYENQIVVGKTQIIRLGDIFFLGPIMILIGLKKEKLSDTEKFVLVMSGIGTLVYNGYNYLKQEQQSKNWGK
jgi:hypothetical protein